MRTVLTILPAVALAFVAVPAAAETDFTLKLAEAVDTNPMRLSGGGSQTGAATRVVAAFEHDGPVGDRGVLSADGRALGHAFHAFPDYSSLGATAGLSLDGRLRTRGSLGFATDLRMRLEPDRECDLSPAIGEESEPCSVNQDYRTVRAVARGGVEFGDLRLLAHAGARHFEYGPSSELWWYGEVTGLAATLEPVDGLRFGVGYERGGRHYLGPRTDVSVGGGVYADPREHRADVGHDVSTWAGWTHRRWTLSLRYSWQRNRSNSTAKSYDRHVLDPSVTGIPVGDLLVRLSARLMRASYDTRGPQDASLNLDEDARNRVSVVVEHPLARSHVFVEAGWAFYAQAFQADAAEGEQPVDGRFRRHLVHVGLTFRATTDRR